MYFLSSSDLNQYNYRALNGTGDDCIYSKSTVSERIWNSLTDHSESVSAASILGNQYHRETQRNLKQHRACTPMSRLDSTTIPTLKFVWMIYGALSSRGIMKMRLHRWILQRFTVTPEHEPLCRAVWKLHSDL